MLRVIALIVRKWKVEMVGRKHAVVISPLSHVKGISLQGINNLKLTEFESFLLFGDGP